MNTTAAPQTVLYIKNMVCDRCRMAVEQIFRRNDLAFDHIELGKVYLHETPTADQLTHLRHDLEQVGFELIDDQRSVLVEQIRTAVLDYVGDRALMEKWKLSAYLSDRLAKSYTLLSSAFSAARGIGSASSAPSFTREGRTGHAVPFFGTSVSEWEPHV